MRYAHAERARRPFTRILDIGCGAGRNAGPLAEAGFDAYDLTATHVVAIDDV